MVLKLMLSSQKSLSRTKIRPSVFGQMKFFSSSFFFFSSSASFLGLLSLFLSSSASSSAFFFLHVSLIKRIMLYVNVQESPRKITDTLGLIATRCYTYAYKNVHLEFHICSRTALFSIFGQRDNAHSDVLDFFSCGFPVHATILLQIKGRILHKCIYGCLCFPNTFLFSAMLLSFLHIEYIVFVLSLRIVVVKVLFGNLMCFQSFVLILNSYAEVV